MWLARISLTLTAIVFAGFGIWFLLDPVGSAAMVDIALRAPLARADYRATYGGLNLGLAVLLFVAALRPVAYGRAGLWLQVGALAGYASGRIAGMVAEGAAPAPLPLFLAAELAGIVLGLLALNSLSRAGLRAG